MKKDLRWLINKTIAHRGASSKERPENSLPAFEEAVKRDLPIELDVHRLKDGTVVVFHDFDTARMCGRGGLVGNYSLERLKKLRLKGTEHQIPTLKEVLELVDGKVGLLIEVKVMFSYKKLCDDLLKTLDGYSGKVAIQSFSRGVIKYLSKKCDYPLGLISLNYRRAGFIGFYGLYLNSVSRIKKVNPDFITYYVMDIPSKMTKYGKEAGMPIFAWTIRNQKHLEHARANADAFITDTRFFDD
ncbi:MAG: glycerophosphodiester phosphodiesterase [Clostridiales bacterium]|nr:glycerophosphodiester phosphodiesterase [Clostridiales bacterium]